MSRRLGFALALILVAASQAQTPALFQSPRHIPVGRQPVHVELADVNADGKLDVLVANSQDGTITVLLGDGHGGVSPAPGSPFAAGPEPNDIAIADFNHDGHLDLAIANHTVPQFTLLLGDGKGGFHPAPGSPFTILTKPHSHGIAAADFNGDGNIDVAIESWAEDKVTVVLGDGKGSFATPGTQYAVGRHPYERLRAADMDGDGRPDIVTANFEGANITVLLSDPPNPRSGRDTLHPSAPNLRDPRSSLRDLRVRSSGVGFQSARFREAPGSPYACPPNPFAHALADVNGDGKPDVVVAHYSGHATDPSKDAVSVLLNVAGTDGRRLAQATRYDAGHLPIAVAVGDINGDKHPDIAVANMRPPEQLQNRPLPGTPVGVGGVTVLLGDGHGAFRTAGFWATGRGPASIAVGDLNGDGKADVVTADTEANQITILLAR
jgi:hypothetical protein